MTCVHDYDSLTKGVKLLPFQAFVVKTDKRRAGSSLVSGKEKILALCWPPTSCKDFPQKGESS